MRAAAELLVLQGLSARVRPTIFRDEPDIRMAGGHVSLILGCLKQCGYGMIYSGSGSSYELLEFRIRIQPILLKHIWKLSKRFNQKEESTIFYFILQQYYSTVTQSRIRGPNIKHKIYIYLLFYVLLDQDPEL